MAPDRGALRIPLQPHMVSSYRLLESGAHASPPTGTDERSRDRILLKSFGYSDATDDVVISGAWKFALSAFTADPTSADCPAGVSSAAHTMGTRVLLAAALRDSHVVRRERSGSSSDGVPRAAFPERAVLLP